MKNFSTGVGASRALRAAAAAVTAACLLTGTAHAARECQFRPNAPDQHVVVKRDTLWDISGKFLEHPWCWPQVWGMNRDEIRNPHWIYPGQIVYFDRKSGRLSLNRPGQGNGQNGEPGVTRLSPQIRTEELNGNNAVPAIPRELIEPLLTQPLIVEPAQLAGAPRIVSAADGSRIYLAKGDRIYVRGALQGNSEYHVFRPAKELRDPETGKVLAHEASFVGAVRLVTAARGDVDVHTFEVLNSMREMGAGDRLLPVPPPTAMNYVPHAPEREVRARVMAISTESNFASQHQVVAVNRGKLDGLDIGSVLNLYHPGRTMKDPGAKEQYSRRGLFGLRSDPATAVQEPSDKTGFLGLGTKRLQLPDEELGNMFIFRVFDRVSYGLVMQNKGPVQIGDMANSPE